MFHEIQNPPLDSSGGGFFYCVILNLFQDLCLYLLDSETSSE